MTFEELKTQVKEELEKKQDLKYSKQEFFILSGVPRYKMIVGGNECDFLSSVYTQFYGIDKGIVIEHLDVSKMGAEELQQKILEYGALLTKTEKAWEELVLEAKKAAMVKNFGKMGLEAVIKSALDGHDIKYSIEDCEGTEMKKVQMGGTYNDHIATIVNPTAAEMPTIVNSMAETIIAMTMAAPAHEDEDTVEFGKDSLDESGRVMAWNFDSRYGDKEKNAERMDICREVIEASRELEFTTEANTLQQLLEGLTSAGLEAEMITSPYNHNVQNIEIKKGHLRIIITRGLMPGMLVSCSPFFAENGESVNVCVSHAPMAQVTEWLTLACDKLSPIADELVPVAEKLKERKQEYNDGMMALEMLKAASGAAGVEYGRCNCELTIGETEISLRDIDYAKKSPKQSVAAVEAFLKLVSTQTTV